MVSLRNKVGLGLATARRPKEGEAKETKNFLHGLREGDSRAELRSYIKRYSVTRAADDDVEGIAELRKPVGTDHVKFAKIGTILYTFDSTGLFSSLQTGLTAGGAKPQFAPGFDRMFMANEDGVLVTDGSTVWDLVSAAPVASISLTTEAGTVTGFGIGQFDYMYSNYNSSQGWETPPLGTFSIVKSNANLGVTIPDPGTYTAFYDKKRIYRRLRNTNQWYLVAEKATGEFPFNDALIETSLTPDLLSTVHDNETGLINAEVPVDSPIVCIHKGRVILAESSKIRWSAFGLPHVFGIESSEYDFDDDEDPVVNIVSLGESVVIFKRRAIWVMNGDLDEDQFTFFPVTKKLGLFGKETFVTTPKGLIFFGSNREFYNFTLDPGSVSVPLQTSVAVDFSGVDADQFEIHSAGWDPLENCAYFTLATSASTFVTYVITIEGYAIGTAEYASITPRCYGEMSEGDEIGDEGRRLMFFGDQQGHIYQTNNVVLADGPPSGTIAGTATGTQTASLIRDTSASFYDVGDGLIGMSVMKVAADGTVEHRTISANNSDTIDVSPDWDTAPVDGVDTYYIGAMHALLWFGGLDDGRPGDKRFDVVYFTYQPGAGTFTFGVTDEEETDKSETAVSEAVTGGATSAVYTHSRCHRISPFVEARATGLRLSLDSVDFNVVPMRSIL